MSQAEVLQSANDKLVRLKDNTNILVGGGGVRGQYNISFITKSISNKKSSHLFDC